MQDAGLANAYGIGDRLEGHAGVAALVDKADGSLDDLVETFLCGDAALRCGAHRFFGGCFGLVVLLKWARVGICPRPPNAS